MQKNSKIFIAGHNGMVGSAIYRNLKNKGFNNFVLKSKNELDLTVQSDVDSFFKEEKPEFVFLAAAKVGGIIANNTYRADFIYDNLAIQNNVINSSFKYDVKKLLFLGSSCIYPKNSPQPIKEDYLLTGPLEYTNEPYAIAKITGIKMCQSYNIQYGCDFISVMPTNLYGPNDNYDLKTSHVLPALIRKFHLAKCLENDDWDSIIKDINKNSNISVTKHIDKDNIIKFLIDNGIIKVYNEVYVTVFGTGIAQREFMHVDDAAEACTFIMENVSGDTLYNKLKKTHINIGTGVDISIRDLTYLIKDTIGFNGGIYWDGTKPDGTLKKQLDVSLINSLGWNYKTNLKEGIIITYKQYKNNLS